MIIHPTAIIHPDAKIGHSVSVGPYSYVGPHVQLKDGVKLHSHVVVEGYTEVGEETEIFPFASIGHIPQDLKYRGEASTLIIGRRNKIREHVTLQPGTEGDKMCTRIGDDCLFMVGSHVAHDCTIGNHVIMANNATLGGHVTLEDYVIVGGLSAIHQFVRVGAHAIIGGMSGVEQDVIPYGSVIGERANLAGLNLVGLKRRGFERSQIHALRQAFRFIFSEGERSFAERLEDFSSEEAIVQELLSFMRGPTKRSFCMPHQDVLLKEEDV